MNLKQSIGWILLMAGSLFWLMAASTPLRGKARPKEELRQPLQRPWTAPSLEDMEIEERESLLMPWAPELPLPVGGPGRRPEGASPVAWPGRTGREEGMEPTVLQVQQAAVRYAEVQPEKIARWRRMAQWRAFFPKFTVSVDQDRDSTIASATSGGKTTFTVGPEDQSAGVAFGFTWDFADLVWNPDQTSIDVRSRLMVQLRHDLLEEVTRLYFERRRLAAEFAAHPSEDPLLSGERALRLEELSAQLDALTGGWFSGAKFKNN